VHRQDFLQLENETVFNEAVIEEREQGIREIHQQIGEVNEIFKDLAVLVHEQGYMIDEIDKNVVGAEAATDQATHQLAKAEESQKSGSNIVSLKLLLVFQSVAHSHFSSFK
jgi:syntaxin 7